MLNGEFQDTPTATSHPDGSNATPLKYNGIVSLKNPSHSDQATLTKSTVRIRNVSDGLSQTAAIAERLIQSAAQRSAILDGDQRLQLSTFRRPVDHWALSLKDVIQPTLTRTHNIRHTWAEPGFPAGHRQARVNVAMADGHVQFVSDDVND